MAFKIAFHDGKELEFADGVEYRFLPSGVLMTKTPDGALRAWPAGSWIELVSGGGHGPVT